ncbi:YbdK family carboxylate-amine ligase [Stieleria sp. JC731]|uniref:carboxylate-amine ligase n=1 Tax=Pirellulaceae TaxID=2691357 RepID=UPI001E42FB29|nr:YbdK family carboxylate-amine ligase [Stieleria sp. JC731]MCC9601281.1 YbdK family carboxylate-amine ligase [Stieleria sp. JC731]
MSKFVFRANDRPSLGIELELGVVDAETFALTSQSNQLLAAVEPPYRDSCKHELMQCCVEVISGVSDSVQDAREDLSGKLSVLQRAAECQGLQLWWGATHPFSHWLDQTVTDDERYKSLMRLLQEMARRLITFGLHVHVGVDSGDKAVMICDRIMHHLPLLLALSSSSPYWEGRDTGLHSHRSKVMEGLPTAGLPTLMRNWSEYVWLVNHMVDTGFINTIREIWWDVRPHHNFGTVEVRMCDMPGNMDHVCGLAALIQCLVKFLSDEIDNGTYQFDCHPMMVRQNKWRASRYGLTAMLVNTYDYSQQSVPEIACDLVDKLQGVAQDLGCETELLYVKEIASSGGWAERQRSILRETGSAKEIVRQLTEQSLVAI